MAAEERERESWRRRGGGAAVEPASFNLYGNGSSSTRYSNKINVF